MATACPSCGFRNLPGADECSHCGAAMTNLDVPRPQNAVEAVLVKQTIASLHFESGVEEIFEVKLLLGYRTPILSGPLPDVDQTEPLWLAPPLATALKRG